MYNRKYDGGMSVLSIPVMKNFLVFGFSFRIAFGGGDGGFDEPLQWFLCAGDFREMPPPFSFVGLHAQSAHNARYS